MVKECEMEVGEIINRFLRIKTDRKAGGFSPYEKIRVLEDLNVNL